MQNLGLVYKVKAIIIKVKKVN